MSGEPTTDTSGAWLTGSLSLSVQMPTKNLDIDILWLGNTSADSKRGIAQTGPATREPHHLTINVLGLVDLAVDIRHANVVQIVAIV